jgi:hypothetical protein
MYPKLLKPTEFENFIINEQVIQIPKCIVEFEKWDGEPLSDTFGGKPVVKVNNKPMFAELAILECFVHENWNSRWIETYGKSKKTPIHLSQWKNGKYKEQEHDPIKEIKIIEMLNEIAKENGDLCFSGCWDVLAWKNANYIFAEAKRSKKDSIRNTQNKWLESALKHGLKIENFLIVQWDFKN